VGILIHISFSIQHEHGNDTIILNDKEVVDPGDRTYHGPGFIVSLPDRYNRKDGV
jgi:hypothetical protein